MLTKTEIEVVQALADGENSAEIARRRFRSAETVRAHIKHARGKLGARTIGQLVRLALKQGLITSLVWFLVGLSTVSGGSRLPSRPAGPSFSVARSARREV